MQTSVSRSESKLLSLEFGGRGTRDFEQEEIQTAVEKDQAMRAGEREVTLQAEAGRDLSP